MDGWMKEEALLPQKVKIEDRGSPATDGNNNKCKISP
jgi:hypothetical protein